MSYIRTSTLSFLIQLLCNTVGWVGSDNVISHGHFKCRSYQSLNVLNGSYMKPQITNQMIVEKQNIAVFDFPDLFPAKLAPDVPVINLQIISFGGYPQFTFC